MERTVTVAALRRLVIRAQGYAPRPRRATTREVEATIRRLSCVQLDSISTVERSHRIVLSTRAGDYPRDAVTRLLARGRIFEYWAHEACLLPIEDWPLHRWRMVSDGLHPWWGAVIDRDPALAERVLGEIRERGALGSRHFEGPRSAGIR